MQRTIDYLVTVRENKNSKGRDLNYHRAAEIFCSLMTRVIQVIQKPTLSACTLDTSPEDLKTRTIIAFTEF